MNLFSNFFAEDIAIDLGTANTLVYVKGKGVILTEPSVVAVNTSTGEVVAVGEEAKKMLGKTPMGVQAIRPLKDGVIADFEAAEALLKYFINKALPKHRLSQPRVIIAVPSQITSVERRAVKESAEKAGAKVVYLIEEPRAAAIGAGLPIDEADGNMVVDIGGGTTEIAIISLSGMVHCASVKVAGDNLDDAIMTYIKLKYNLLIGYKTAENIKIRIGNAYPQKEETDMEIKGRDLLSGLPKSIKINSTEIRESMAETIAVIIRAIKSSLEECPPELASDLLDRGLVLAGGGALIRGLKELIQEETNLPVFIADDPLTAIANGSGMALANLSLLEKAT